MGQLGRFRPLETVAATPRTSRKSRTMPAPRPVARWLVAVLSALATTAALMTPAVAEPRGQTVSGDVFVAVPDGDQAAVRAGAAASYGNGVAWHVFDVAAATVGGAFSLTAGGSPLAGDVAITFYDDFASGEVCARHATAGPEQGYVCGAVAVVWAQSGGPTDFDYVAADSDDPWPPHEHPLPPPPPSRPEPLPHPTQPVGAVPQLPSAPAVAYQLNSRHDGGAADDAAPHRPLHRAWSAKIGRNLSYPLIAEGRVFVTHDNGEAAIALDAVTGQELWRTSLSHGYNYGALAYDDGRLFVLTGQGLLRALDPETGGELWHLKLGGEYSLFNSPPTAYDGLVYVGGPREGGGGSLYAISADAGELLWTRSVANGDHSAPTVDASGVYVGYACNQVYKFDLKTGRPVWHYTTDCAGGGGRTTVLSQGRLYTRDYFGNLVIDTDKGEATAQHWGYFAPAFGNGSGFFTTRDGWLVATDEHDGQPRWSFRPGPMITTAPLALNGAVYTGTEDGHIYALDGISGDLLWEDTLGAPLAAPDEHNLTALTGMAAGEGVLVVPTNDTLFAYGHRD